MKHSKYWVIALCIVSLLLTAVMVGCRQQDNEGNGEENSQSTTEGAGTQEDGNTAEQQGGSAVNPNTGNDTAGDSVIQDPNAEDTTDEDGIGDVVEKPDTGNADKPSGGNTDKPAPDQSGSNTDKPSDGDSSLIPDDNEVPDLIIDIGGLL